MSPVRRAPVIAPAAPEAVSAAMAEVSSAGGYFELDEGEAEPGWRPLTDLLTDRALLERRVAEVAVRLGTDQPRVAASIQFQGLAARLWSPVVGAVAAHDLLLDLAPDRLHWYPAPAGPLPLRAVRPAGRRVPGPVEAAVPMYRGVVTGLLEPLALAVREVVGIAPGLLWGNAASALAGAVCVLAGRRPDLATRAVALGRELLGTGLLRDTGELDEPVPGRPVFTRRSCCLYYRLPGGGKCGDCVLLAGRARSRTGGREGRA
ncbi:(2Fe-2S)-binding protein [Streptosporangium sp. NPDC049376]|uniref:(2Fe-2S)-binding protein n=1 Tax=Streptosporangium sp. NPDC049376 TaxID=3366192 RepID=UPI0037970CFC